jgi:hypothetical protein
MVINQLLDNLPLCITNDYYPIFSHNLLSTQFFDIDIDTLHDPPKKPTQWLLLNKSNKWPTLFLTL